MNRRIEQAEFDQIVRWQEGDTEAITLHTLSNLKRIPRVLNVSLAGWGKRAPIMKFPIWAAKDEEDSWRGFPNLPPGVPVIEIDFRDHVVTIEKLFSPTAEPLVLATLNGITIGRRGLDFEISDQYYKYGLSISRRSRGGAIVVAREPLHPIR